MCIQGPLASSGYWGDPQTDLWVPAPCPAWSAVWVNPCGDALLSSFYQQTETCPVQSELLNVETALT